MFTVGLVCFILMSWYFQLFKRVLKFFCKYNFLPLWHLQWWINSRLVSQIKVEIEAKSSKCKDSEASSSREMVCIKPKFRKYCICMLLLDSQVLVLESRHANMFILKFWYFELKYAECKCKVSEYFKGTLNFIFLQVGMVKTYTVGSCCLRF